MDNPTDSSLTAVATRLGPLRVQTVGSGPPAVLWHSLFVDSTSWVPVRQPLATVRRLLLIDGPGHGNNPPVPRLFTLNDCAGAAVDILDHLGIQEPVDWVGNAWGGHVGIPFAAAYPERCRSLATIGTPVRALTPRERRRTVLALPFYRLLGPIGPLVDPITDALLGRHTKTTDPEARTLVADAFRRANRRGMRVAIQSISINRPDLTDLLAKVGTPTLFAAGADDAMWTPAEAAAAARHLPHGAFVTLPGAGHIAPLLEAAPAVVELLTAFWADPAAVIARHQGATPPPASHTPAS